MNLDKLQEFANCIGTGVEKTRRGEGGHWAVAKCPLAHWKHKGGVDRNASFGMKIMVDGQSNMHCFSCGFSGDGEDLLMLIQHYGPPDFFEMAAAVELAQADDVFSWSLGSGSAADELEAGAHAVAVIAFPEWFVESFAPAVTSTTAMEYLVGRKVSAAMAEYADMKWDGLKRRVCFPIRSFEGVLVGVQGRAVDKDVMPPHMMYPYEYHTNNSVWLGEDRIDLMKPVVLVEGVFDWLRTSQVYRNVLSGFGVNVTKARTKRIESALSIITLFDHGEAGDVARASVSKLMSHARVRHLLVLNQDSDPGSSTVNELVEVLGDYVDLDDLLL